MILYAPIINPVIPAFVGDDVTIYYQHNLAINWNEPSWIKVLIRDYLTNKALGEFQISMGNPVDNEENAVTVVLSGIDFIPGNFYKIQIAYVDGNGECGPYSAAGLTRYLGATGVIQLSVTSLSSGTNKHRISYSGKYYYSNSNLTENVYQYRFKMRLNDNDIEDSGWLIPKKLENGEIDMSYTFENELKYFNTYILDFTIKTVNGYEQTKSYYITKTGLYPTQLQATLVATQSIQAKENGYVEIFLEGDTSITGTFRLIRQAYGEHNWEELTRCSMAAGDDLSTFYWRDYSVEQGQYYTYGFQQYGVGTDKIPYYSTPILAIIKEVEFEHMYLGDDQYQLKIAFNPQVSSFKETILENKVETIGGKYPTFFRNGNVRYAEIPISGLLSCLLDDDGYFLPISKLYPGARDLQGNAKISTALTNHNFASERQFKMAVLKWLNNGKPKLFRSPAEGNYVLRLMNVNISPNAQVGRMLHTFSATGYEVMPASPKAMLNAYDPILSFSIIKSANTENADGGFGNKAQGNTPNLKTNQSQNSLVFSADTTVVA